MQRDGRDTIHRVLLCARIGRCWPSYELVASFGNLSKALKEWKKTGRRGIRASTAYRPANVGPCTSSVRVNTRGLPGDRHKSKKASTSRSSWPPSGPLSPGDALDAGCVDTRRRLRSPLWLLPTIRLAHTPAGCCHGGTRKRSTARSVHTRSVSPAAMAGVQGCHCFAEPVPLVGSGWGRGWRTLAWGKQKL